MHVSRSGRTLQGLLFKILKKLWGADFISLSPGLRSELEVEVVKTQLKAGTNSPMAVAWNVWSFHLKSVDWQDFRHCFPKTDSCYFCDKRLRWNSGKVQVIVNLGCWKAVRMKMSSKRLLLRKLFCFDHLDWRSGESLHNHFSQGTPNVFVCPGLLGHHMLLSVCGQISTTTSAHFIANVWWSTANLVLYMDEHQSRHKISKDDTIKTSLWVY